MKEGFWGNYETGVWFPIDEHERWLRRGDNAVKLGVPEDVIAAFPRFADRETLLPFVFRHAPVMRWRCHGADVTFEFYAEDWQRPLALIRKWGRAYAGEYLHFRMVNFCGMEIRAALWRDLRLEEETASPDALHMIQPQSALLARFRKSDGVCLIADPVWKSVPRLKLYRLDGVDRDGHRTELLFAENRNGNPGFAKAQLDKTLASPYLFLSGRHGRIVQENRLIAACDSCAAAIDSYLPRGFLPIVTRRQQALRKVIAVLGKHLVRRQDQMIDAAILQLECIILPDWHWWREKGDPEKMSHLLHAKLLRLGYGIKHRPGEGSIIVNSDGRPEFFAQIADFAAFAGVEMLFLKHGGGDELEKLDLVSGKGNVIPGDGFRRSFGRADYERGRYFLRNEHLYDPLQAAEHALHLDFFRHLNMFSKMGRDAAAKRFDAAYSAARQHGSCSAPGLFAE